MWIWFASLPILIIVLGWLIHKELRPIKRLSQEVQTRKIWRCVIAEYGGATR